MERMPKVAGDERPYDVLIKREVECLPENTHALDLVNQELQVRMEPLGSIKTEKDPFHTNAEVNAVHEFRPVDETGEYLKTELMLDEELIEDMNEEAKCKQDVLANHQCGICSRSFKTKWYLKVHLPTHSKDRRREFACDLCGKAFYGKSELSKHKRIHSGDRYACKVCGDGFMKKESLKTHMLRRQHFDKTQKFTLQSSNNDVAPMKTELISDEEFIDKGNVSESVFYAVETQQLALAGDNKQQTGIDTAMDGVTCEVCHNSYPGELIKTHMRLTHNNNAYKCQFCSRSCVTKTVLKVHLRSHSKDRSREFACDLCEKAFYDKKNLNEHKKIHTGDGYPCKVCGKRFTTKSNFKAHKVRRQHFDKPQQITPPSSNNDVASMKTELMSDEEFIDEGNGTDKGTQQPALAGDNKQHTGIDAVVGSVTCEICHNIYPGQLIKAHMRLTHNDKAYKCQICSRSFKTKWDLKVHLRTHSKDRRREFACDLCGKSFYEKSKLSSHKKIHTGDLNPCKVCGYRFMRKEDLMIHMVRRQHFDKTQPFPPQSSNNDVASVKTELISDEEFIDEENGSESVSHFEASQP